MKRSANVLSILLIVAGFAFTSCKQDYRLIAGGFTEKDGEKGLAVFDFNSRNGDLTLVSESDVGPSPSYFCYSKKNSMFYVLNEVMEFNGTFGGGLTSLRYDNAKGEFEKKGEMLIPYGGPCFISMSADSSYLFIASYPNGSVSVVKLDDSGIPSSVTDTILYYKPEPDLSHAHMIMNDPAGKHVYVTDLGLNRIYIYNFDTATGRLNQLQNGVVRLPDDSGPRHFSFNADGSKLYVINELGSTIMTFGVDEDGGLVLLQTLKSTGKDFLMDNFCADLHPDKSGKYLYGSNRGENTIVTFSVGDEGLLTLAGQTSCGGDWPRNFTIDPSGKYVLVANQKSDSISVLKIDRTSGIPSKLVSGAKMTKPACLKFY